MLTIQLVNIGAGDDGTTDYRVHVNVNYQTIASGVVTGHRREEPWTHLVRRVVEQFEPSPKGAL